MIKDVRDLVCALEVSHVLPVDGELAHKRIPAAFWCVALCDLRKLKRLVKLAVLQDSIRPTDLDPFDAHDHKFGPNIHTVNAQFIKPITALAGNCSWALMCHPNGCKCDIFITHAWQEGLYEFIDKVVHSWPTAAHFAYCCMLSNPQNLDIAGAIATPIQSPFAKALQSATHVLAVPNRQVSIYSRIWCVYEAYLGYTWDKIIYTATSPIHRGTYFWMELIIAISMWPIGLKVGCWMNSVENTNNIWASFQTEFCPVLYWILFVLSTFSGPSCRTRWVNYLGLITVGIRFRVDWYEAFESDRNHPVNDCITLASRLLMASFFVMAEADRMWALGAQVEARYLKQSFTGHIRDASSSSERDKSSIWREIDESRCAHEVEQAVSVLILAGMSTPSLREAAKAGVNVTEVGRPKASVALLGWGFWILGPLCDLASAQVEHASILDRETSHLELWMIRLTAMECFACAVIWLVLPLDRKIFANAAVLYVFFICYGAVEFIGLLAEFFLATRWTGDSEAKGLDQTYTGSLWSAIEAVCGKSVFVDALFTGPLTLMLSAMGPGKTSRLPVIGQYLTQYVLGNLFSWKGFFGLFQLCQRSYLQKTPVNGGIELVGVCCPPRPVCDDSGPPPFYM